MANFTKFFSKSYYFNTLFNSFKVSIGDGSVHCDWNAVSLYLLHL